MISYRFVPISSQKGVLFLRHLVFSDISKIFFESRTTATPRAYSITLNMGIHATIYCWTPNIEFSVLEPPNIAMYF